MNLDTASDTRHGQGSAIELHFGHSVFAPSQPERTTPQANMALAHSLAASALDVMAHPVIIIDPFARVVQRNAAADRLLDRRDCVAVDSGYIIVTHMPDVREFSRALTQAAAGQRSMIALGLRSHVTVAVVPLRTAAKKPVEHFALVFSRTQMSEPLMIHAFAKAYLATPMEERVLQLISEGMTVPQMAKHLGIGTATVRTHVRNLCLKTNCHGLREIVTLMAVMPTLSPDKA